MLPSPSLYHPRPLLSKLRDARPVAPVVTADGKRAWLVTRYEDVRQGAYYCLGAQLARMELQEALRGLLGRMPKLRVAVHDAALRFGRGMLVRSLESLPITW